MSDGDTLACRACKQILTPERAYADDDWNLLCLGCALALPVPPCRACRGWGCKRRCRPAGERTRSRLEVCACCGGEG